MGAENLKEYAQDASLMDQVVVLREMLGPSRFLDSDLRIHIDPYIIESKQKNTFPILGQHELVEVWVLEIWKDMPKMLA